jgi:predicted SAM-dependent methyltransferase
MERGNRRNIWTTASSSDKPFRLDLGCGEGRRVASDGRRYVRIDIREDCEPDIVADVSRLDMIEDNSADEVVAYHILEHFSFREAPAVLAEWYRVLRPGGVIQVRVPNFRTICREFADGTRPTEQAVSDVFGGQEHRHNFHHSGYDCDYLRGLLERAGFRVAWSEESPGEVSVQGEKPAARRSG